MKTVKSIFNTTTPLNQSVIIKTINETLDTIPESPSKIVRYAHAIRSYLYKVGGFILFSSLIQAIKPDTNEEYLPSAFNPMIGGYTVEALGTNYASHPFRRFYNKENNLVRRNRTRSYWRYPAAALAYYYMSPVAKYQLTHGRLADLS